MIQDVEFEFYRGDTYSRDFTLSGWSLPVSKVYFTVKDKVTDKKAVLQKTLDNGITLVSDEEGIKTFNLLIGCTDTDNMKAEYDYPFDIEIHSPGVGDEVIKKTIVAGVVRLIASSTRTCNEC